MRTANAVVIPRGMLYDPWLSSIELRVWGILAHKADEHGQSDIPAQQIAELLNVQRGTVQRSITGLVKAGYLVKLAGPPSTLRQVVRPREYTASS